MATKTPAAAPASACCVLSPLHHNGTVYAPGDAVSLDDAEAEALLALGVISRSSPAADPEPADPEPAA